jgi:hypothetical protein
MKTAPLNPAAHVIAISGGVDAVAAICGVNRIQVHRWTYTKAKGGTGGLVPSQHQVTLLEWARENDVALTPDDFFLGISASSEAA